MAATASDIVTHHRHHHYGGTLMLIAMSLDSLGLPQDEQLRVDALQEQLLNALRPARLAERELFGLLADDVAKSRFGHREIDAAIERVAAASRAAQTHAAQDLNRLHDLLTPPQRAAFVDKLESHWALWKQATSDAPDSGAVMGFEIGLRPDQVRGLNRQIDARTDAPAWRHTGDIERRLHAFENAFQADTFDARPLAVDAADATQSMVTKRAAGAGHLGA